MNLKAFKPLPDIRADETITLDKADVDRINSTFVSYVEKLQSNATSEKDAMEVVSIRETFDELKDVVDGDWDKIDMVIPQYKDMTREELIEALEAHDAHHQEHHVSQDILIKALNDCRKYQVGDELDKIIDPAIKSVQHENI